MAGRSKILPVPYFVQPTPVTCQSTVLRMMATYLEESVLKQSTGAGERPILDIWKDVNQDPARPSTAQNAHANFKWWLERHFPSLTWEYSSTKDEVAAIDKIIAHVDGGFPVLVSVSHVKVAGHIILVIGYENHLPLSSSPDFRLVVHDPYGKFDPSLLSNLYGKSRFDGGASLVGGGETGPGAGVRLPVSAVGRQRTKDSARGTYYTLSAKGTPTWTTSSWSG